MTVIKADTLAGTVEEVFNRVRKGECPGDGKWLLDFGWPTGKRGTVGVTAEAVEDLIDQGLEQSFLVDQITKKIAAEAA